MTSKPAPIRRQDLTEIRSYMPTTHGSAHFMSPAQVAATPSLSKPAGGHFLGWIARPGTDGDIRLFANGDGNTLSCGPIGSGKGTCQILTNLLSHADSTLVLDISIENYDISSQYRSTLGQVFRFAPWSDGHRWNPLDHIDCNDPKAAEESAIYLGSLMISQQGDDVESYWTTAAKTELEGVMLYVASAPLSTVKNGPEVTERNMKEVVRLLSLAPDLFESLLACMATSPMPYVRFCSGVTAQVWRAPEQFAGVHGHLLEQIKPWASERIANATATSDFRCDSLRTRGTTLYLCIPPEYLKSHAGIVRTLVGCAMRELKNSADKGPPVLFMLDEFPSLGTVTPIADNLAYLRKYGVRFWWFIQNMAQLKQHYPDAWENFVANATYQCYFGTSDLETAKTVSERIGTATVATRSFNEGMNWGSSRGGSDSRTSGTSSTHTSGEQHSTSSGTSHSTTEGSNWSINEGVSAGQTLSYHGRRLVTPEEILSMHRLEQIIFVRGLPPLRAALLPYYEHPLLKSRAGRWSSKDQG